MTSDKHPQRCAPDLISVLCGLLGSIAYGRSKVLSTVSIEQEIFQRQRRLHHFRRSDMGDSIRHQSASPRPSQELKSTPLARTPSTSMRLAQNSSPSHPHRQSYHEQLRGFPPSPRANRHLSLSQSQIQELLNNPPATGPSDPKFSGRDWQHIQVGELIDPKNLHFVELDTGIEAATNVSSLNKSPELPA